MIRPEVLGRFDFAEPMPGSSDPELLKRLREIYNQEEKEAQTYLDGVAARLCKSHCASGLVSSATISLLWLFSTKRGRPVRISSHWQRTVEAGSSDSFWVAWPTRSFAAPPFPY